MKIRRERLLPRAGEVVVTPGQEVNPVQVVARTSHQRGFTIVDAADILDVSPADVPKYLLVEEGAAVQKKKPLLQKKGMFGSKSYSSPVNGILYQVSHGRLILQQTSDLIELRAMIRGVVAGYLGSRGVIIETQGSLIQGIWGSGREGFGTIKIASERNDAPLRKEHIGADARGAVLVAGYIDRPGVLEEAESNSVRGVIVGSVPTGMLHTLPALRFPIIVTEGFRQQPMAPPIFRLLQQSEGREASLFGADTGTWSRPEIVIPLPASDAVQQTADTLQPLAVGQRVRLLRAPHAGAVGEVIAVYERARATEVGFRMPGATVAINEEEVLFVPYPNLDLIR
ncbi:MAG TPA: hypothetical protein VK879_04280 [Candidatus Sulfomarinibacteraceae bacterium]|nr:hypothetical protein [Candidatus Sulfomarinibacteraceae bacterium]